MKKKEKRESPVPNGHDERGSRRDRKDHQKTGRPEAPDGISGDWN